MKQQWILALAITMGTSLAMAGTFKADDFNQMMKENQKIEKDLRSNLQKEAGIEFDDEPGQIAKDKIIAPADPEQVVVSTTIPFFEDRKTPTEKKLDKEEMQRISQELDEAFAN